MNGISGMLCTAPRFCCFSAAPAAAATSAAAAAAASSRHTDSVASTGGHALTNLNINCTSPNSKALFDSWFKRGISENFIVPGTKWCGPHQTATRYGELGPLSLMDRCCRRHDNCKTNIPAFTNKYNMFNLRPFTISHCHCDTRKKEKGKKEKERKKERKREGNHLFFRNKIKNPKTYRHASHKNIVEESKYSQWLVNKVEEKIKKN
ncbi:Uncharacterized protein GBIM_15728 [Gryllus bimaculatus]|nr:Uncharacterized protein GBIM_15728 [Gryllus bimaculatus]